jgi:[ribosomal protein S5]-alanine N-acetyltransferase
MLETERLLLREFTLDDVDAFFEMCTDPKVTRYTHDAGLTNRDEARAILLAHPIADYQKYGFGRWACVLKSSGQVIGFAGLKYLEDLGEVDIGYRLMPAYWGVGLATEASRAAIEDGFTRLHLEHIIGLVAPENVASVRVLEKLGLRFVEMIEYRSSQVAKYDLRRSTD